jgi:hypothetical protein
MVYGRAEIEKQHFSDKQGVEWAFEVDFEFDMDTATPLVNNF